MDANTKSQAVDRIKEAEHVLVTVSANPSVDQLSAAIGLTLLLNKLHKHATAVFSGKVPSTLEFLQPDETLETNTDSLQDFIVSLDKSKADKLRYKVEDDVVRIFITPYRTSLSEADLNFTQGDFNVDVVIALGVDNRDHLDQAIMQHGRILHDATVISLMAGDAQSDVGSINWQDKNASSLCEMITSVSESFGADLIDNQIATALLTGIVATTDRFKNENTTPRVMTMSAQLMASGANQQLIANELATPVIEAEAELASEDQPEETDNKGYDVADGVLSLRHDQDAEHSVSFREENRAKDTIAIDESGSMTNKTPDGITAQPLVTATTTDDSTSNDNATSQDYSTLQSSDSNIQEQQNSLDQNLNGQVDQPNQDTLPTIQPPIVSQSDNSDDTNTTDLNEQPKDNQSVSGQVASDNQVTSAPVQDEDQQPLQTAQQEPKQEVYSVPEISPLVDQAQAKFEPNIVTPNPVADNVVATPTQAETALPEVKPPSQEHYSKFVSEPPRAGGALNATVDAKERVYDDPVTVASPTDKETTAKDANSSTPSPLLSTQDDAESVSSKTVPSTPSPQLSDDAESKPSPLYSPLGAPVNSTDTLDTIDKKVEAFEATAVNQQDAVEEALARVRQIQEQQEAQGAEFPKPKESIGANFVPLDSDPIKEAPAPKFDPQTGQQLPAPEETAPPPVPPPLPQDGTFPLPPPQQ